METTTASGRVARQLTQQSHQLDARRHIEKRRRLVEHEQQRLLRERARDHHALALAVGEPAEIALREMAHADRVDRPVDDTRDRDRRGRPNQPECG